jgi:hypothetical protein
MFPNDSRWGVQARLWMLVILLIGTVSCQRPARLTGPSPESTPGERSAARKENDSGGVSRSSVSDRGIGPNSSDSRIAQDQQPNWIGDPRYLREKNASPTVGSSGSGTGKGQPPGTAGGVTGGGITVGSPGGGSLPVTPVSPTVPANSDPPRPSTITRPSVTQADMQEVWIYMENASAVSGRLPQPAEVYAALVQTQAKAAELVRSGAIILTGAKNRESVWAFEASALQQGGWLAGPGGVEQVTAAELRRRLSQSR